MENLFPVLVFRILKNLTTCCDVISHKFGKKGKNTCSFTKCCLRNLETRKLAPGLNLVCIICCKNPCILLKDKFQNADCINKTDSFQKVRLNKDVVQAEYGCWKDLKLYYDSGHNKFLQYFSNILWTNTCFCTFLPKFMGYDVTAGGQIFKYSKN